jgi:cyclohexadieny/prephenate dehydrogenase
MRVTTLAIVGIGLLGGSLALAARRRQVAARIIGVDAQPASLEHALQRNLIDATADLPAAAAAAELMVFCTPVDCIAAQILAAAPACRPGCLLTDVGSTKAEIVRNLEGRLPPDVVYVGSHPLAGSEKNGPYHASAALFEQRQVLVTPTPSTDIAAVERITSFWQALGATVRLMDPEAHDRALALTSHLPHVAASALAGVLPVELFTLTATGFRDTTRLAASNPAMWSAILQSNAAAVLEALGRYGKQLECFRAALAGNDRAALEALLAKGKQNKDALSDG